MQDLEFVGFQSGESNAVTDVQNSSDVEPLQLFVVRRVALIPHEDRKVLWCVDIATTLHHPQYHVRNRELFVGGDTRRWTS